MHHGGALPLRSGFHGDAARLFAPAAAAGANSAREGGCLSGTDPRHTLRFRCTGHKTGVSLYGSRRSRVVCLRESGVILYASRKDRPGPADRKPRGNERPPECERRLRHKRLREAVHQLPEALQQHHPAEELEKRDHEEQPE